jgi:thiol-disulfide isomerase/thioredoxin
MIARMNRTLAGFTLVGVVLVSGCGALAADQETVIPLRASDMPTTTSTGVTSITPEERGEPLTLSGASLAGQRLGVANSRGRITVVNFWASWCAPCREEIPEFADTARALPAVAFIGVNVEDDLGDARAFSEALPYPSIVDVDGSLLEQVPNVPPKALPITLILDSEGRVAVRIIGPIPPGSLRELIASVT